MRSRANARAWNGTDAAARYAGVEIKKWTPPSQQVRSTAQDDFVAKNPVPARPADWTRKKQPVAYTARQYPITSSHLTDYHAWPDVRRKAVLQEPRDPADARGGRIGTTTTADSYQPPLHGPRHIPHQTIQPGYVARSAGMYASSYSQDYVPHASSQRAPSMRPPALASVRAARKTGPSSYACEYYAKELNPKVVPWQNTDRRKLPVGSSGHTGSSTHKADYHAHAAPPPLRLDLGVQTCSRSYEEGGTGGQFQLMIAAGSAAPAETSMQFTTVADAQQLAAIVVVARRGGEERGEELGHFTLTGLKAAGAGVPRVRVTFTLLKEQLLKVSATYEQGHRTRNLVLNDRRSVRGLLDVV